MKVFNSNYFGNFTIFEFQDCNGITEISKGACQLSNHLELHNSFGFLLIIFGFIFASYLFYVLVKLYANRDK